MRPRLELELVLWGRRAMAEGQLVRAAAAQAFHESFDLPAQIEDMFQGPVSERIATSFMGPQRVLVEFVSPCDTGRGRNGAMNPLSLDELLGNLAHDLVQWNLHDTNPEVTKEESDSEADLARSYVRALSSLASVDAAHIECVELGTFRSGSNRRNFPVAGYQGTCIVTDVSEELLHWLLLLELRGAGSHKSYGLGQVRIWLPAADVRER